MAEKKTIGVRALRNLERYVTTYGKRQVLDAVNEVGSSYKECPDCEETLHESKFYVRGNGYLSGYCKICNRKRAKQSKRILRKV